MRVEQRFRVPSPATFRASIPVSEARIAIVHEWLYTYAGAEKVLEQILDLFPQAVLHSLIDFLPESERKFLGGREVKTSFLQKLPFVRTHHQYFLPFMPIAMERFDLSKFDIVITSSYAVAKGVLTGPNQLHLCYCHSPVRYAWDLQHQYLQQWHMERGAKSMIATAVLHKLRIWDHIGSNGVDHFMANSRFIARRIWKTYRRRATVVYPPVDTEKFTPGPESERDETYVTTSRLVGYKRVDILVDAFKELPDKKLVVIGTGEDLGRLRESAPPNVSFLGRAPNDVLLAHLRKAKAFLFAAEEDFGISPVEAQACGIPVIAYGKGGALETVRGVWSGGNPNYEPTGVFFPRQDVPSLLEAIRFFEAHSELFNSKTCVEHSKQFSPGVFRRNLLDEVQNRWKRFQLRERDPNATWDD